MDSFSGRHAGRDRSAWAGELTDERVLTREQEKFRRTWTLLGHTADIPKDGDWFTAELWGYSVFVQRFGLHIAGFENRCAHRFYPLRTERRGNGAPRCQFHGWRYDERGVATKIPMCQEFFGCSERELDARLTPIEIGLCGDLIFGRFPGERQPDLATYLGDIEPIIRLMSKATAPGRLEMMAEANWKLIYHIGIEDYHIVAIHPSTFGSNGPLREGHFRYFRCDPHSAMFTGEGYDDYSLSVMAADCAAGRYQPVRYRIFQIFPSTLILHKLIAGRWYVLLYHYVPLSAARTLVRCWYHPADFGPRLALRRLAVDWIVDPFRRLGIRYYMRKISGEDHKACEQLQKVAHQIKKRPFLGAQEERLAWFDEAYAKAMASDG